VVNILATIDIGADFSIIGKPIIKDLKIEDIV
jgi:hypothetical protein